jgi:hypothetical protein
MTPFSRNRCMRKSWAAHGRRTAREGREDGLGVRVHKERHGQAAAVLIVWVHDAVRGGGQAPPGEERHHVAGVADHHVGRRVHRHPLAIAGEQLQAGAGGGGQDGDEVDVFVRGGAHGAGDRAAGQVGVMNHPQDGVAVFGQGVKQARTQAEVLADGVEEQLSEALQLDEQRRESWARRRGARSGKRFLGILPLKRQRVLAAQGATDVPELLEIPELLILRVLDPEGGVAALATIFRRLVLEPSPSAGQREELPGEGVRVVQRVRRDAVAGDRDEAEPLKPAPRVSMKPARAAPPASWSRRSTTGMFSGKSTRETPPGRCLRRIVGESRVASSVRPGRPVRHHAPVRVFACDHLDVPLPPGHRFPMEKYGRLRHALVTAGLLGPAEITAVEPAPLEPLLAVHAPDYVHAVVERTLPAACTASHRPAVFRGLRRPRTRQRRRHPGRDGCGPRGRLRGQPLRRHAPRPPRLRCGLLRLQRSGDRRAMAAGSRPRPPGAGLRRRRAPGGRHRCPVRRRKARLHLLGARRGQLSVSQGRGRSRTSTCPTGRTTAPTSPPSSAPWRRA